MASGQNCDRLMPLQTHFSIIIARSTSSCGKVMFSQVSVNYSVPGKGVVISGTRSLLGGVGISGVPGPFMGVGMEGVGMRIWG